MMGPAVANGGRAIRLRSTRRFRAEPSGDTYKPSAMRGLEEAFGVGTKHARQRVLAFADEHHVTVAHLTTGEVLSVHLIEPHKTYWRNQNNEPGRWPGSPR
jgi:hypothetical protein